MSRLFWLLTSSGVLALTTSVRADSFPAQQRQLALSTPLAQVKDAPALQRWVASGGVLRVSSDAAQLFGFKTVPPRERTRERAGQRFGRATSALALGASPLLWSAEAASSQARTDGFPGVREVFYQLPASGDVLLSSAGSGSVPLLRVEENGSALLVAAMRRYGRGWVVFSPRLIEARADGQAFERNIRDFCLAAARDDWASVPALALSDKSSWDERLARLADLNDQPDAKREPSSVTDELALPVSKGEREAIESVWQRAAQKSEDEAAQSRARALVTLLRVRLAWLAPSLDSKGDLSVAPPVQTPAWREGFWQRQQSGDYAPFARWWNGVLALQSCDPANRSLKI